MSIKNCLYEEIVAGSLVEMERLDVTMRQLEFYESLGFSFIPIRERDKVPLVSWLKFQKRKPHDKEVAKWLMGFWMNRANVGIVCGSISGGLVVLDFDKETAWNEFCNAWKKRTGNDITGETPVVKTTRGYHVYVRCKQTVKKQRLPVGIDIQGEGTFVVAPPSVSATHHKYHFLKPEITQILEVNALDELGITCGVPEALDCTQQSPLTTANISDGVPEGMRNNSCFKMAIKYMKSGLPFADTLSLLLIDWNTKCVPPLTDAEVKACVRSAYSYRDKATSTAFRNLQQFAQKTEEDII